MGKVSCVLCGYSLRRDVAFIDARWHELHFNKQGSSLLRKKQVSSVLRKKVLCRDCMKQIAKDVVEEF